ncbi:peptidoglycan-binding domain-containing protein [Streptomyces sp. NPDC003006]
MSLKPGDQGRAVKELECLLDRCGYDPGPIDGVFDLRTRDALVRFQRDHGLVIDGQTGQATWRALRACGST